MHAHALEHGLSGQGRLHLASHSASEAAAAFAVALPPLKFHRTIPNPPCLMGVIPPDVIPAGELIGSRVNLVALLRRAKSRLLTGCYRRKNFVYF